VLFVVDDVIEFGHVSRGSVLVSRGCVSGRVGVRQSLVIGYRPGAMFTYMTSLWRHICPGGSGEKLSTISAMEGKYTKERCDSSGAGRWFIRRHNVDQDGYDSFLWLISYDSWFMTRFSERARTCRNSSGTRPSLLRTWGQRSPGVKLKGHLGSNAQRSEVKPETQRSEVISEVKPGRSTPRELGSLTRDWGHIRLGWSRDKMYKNQKKSKVITALGHAGSFRSRGILITIWSRDQSCHSDVTH